jgi:hypothetical protein
VRVYTARHERWARGVSLATLRRWAARSLVVALLGAGAALLDAGCGASPSNAGCSGGACASAGASGGRGLDGGAAGGAPAGAGGGAVDGALDRPAADAAGDAPVSDGGPPLDAAAAASQDRADAPPSDGGSPDVSLPPCPASMNRCLIPNSYACLPETATTCGPSCAPCAVPSNGVATCTTGSCSQQCVFNKTYFYACPSGCCAESSDRLQEQTDATDMAMAMDAAGRPHIVWATHPRLWYAELTAAGWKYRTIDPADGDFVGLSIALDSAGQPHVSYSGPSNVTKYAHLVGNAWAITTVDANAGGSFSSIALAGDLPRIAYTTGFPAEALRHAQWDGTTWTLETVSPASVTVWYPSLAIDAAGVSHVAYADASAGTLWHATRGATAWSVEPIGPSGTTGFGPSLAIDPASGQPRVAYSDRTTHAVYAERAASGWTTQTADATGTAVRCSLRLDHAGNPVIAYFGSASPAMLMVARRSAGSWSTAMVGDLDYYQRLALGLDATDRAFVAFVDFSRTQDFGRLRLVSPAASGYTMQTLDAAVVMGQALSLKLDPSGGARIAYIGDAPIGYGDTGVETTARTLWYAEQIAGGWSLESVDLSGTAAGPAIVVDGNGVASIAYQASGQLTWARRPQGPGSWTFETADAAAGTGEYPSAALDGAGHAFVSYFDRTGGDLKVASNASGAWQASAVDTAGVVGLWTSLALDGGGAPHVVYYDQTGTRLKHAFAAGAAWTLEVADALSGADVGQYASLAIDAGGILHAASFDATHTRIRYAVHTDAWSATTLDPLWSGWSVSLALGPTGAPRLAAVDDSANHTGMTGDYSAQTIYLALEPGGWVTSHSAQALFGPYAISLAVDGADHPHLAVTGPVFSTAP